MLCLHNNNLERINAYCISLEIVTCTGKLILRGIFSEQIRECLNSKILDVDQEQQLILSKSVGNLSDLGKIPNLLLLMNFLSDPRLSTLILWNQSIKIKVWCDHQRFYGWKLNKYQNKFSEILVMLPDIDYTEAFSSNF